MQSRQHSARHVSCVGDGREREEGGPERCAGRWRPSSGKEPCCTATALHCSPPHCTAHPAVRHIMVLTPPSPRAARLVPCGVRMLRCCSARVGSQGDALGLRRRRRRCRTGGLRPPLCLGLVQAIHDRRPLGTAAAAPLRFRLCAAGATSRGSARLPSSSHPCARAQAYKSYGVPEKQDRFPLFVAMGVGSVVALGMMKVFKPKKKKA